MRKQNLRSGRGSLILLVLLMLAGVVVFMETRSPESEEAAAENEYPIPDPDTTGMEVQVVAAISTARSNVVSNPRSAESWGRLAAVLDAHGLRTESEPAYRRAVELAPDVLEYSYNLAVVLEMLGKDLDESLALFRDAARLNPDFPPAQYRIGMVLELQGDLKQAAVAYRRAIALDPNLALAHRSLGQILLSLDDCPGAIAALERSSALAPMDGIVHGLLAQACTCIGETERAESLAEKATELGIGMDLPDPVRFLVTSRGVSARLASDRARGLFHEGDYVGALRDLKIVVTARPNNPRAQEEIAEVYRLLGDLDQARIHLERAAKLRRKP